LTAQIKTIDVRQTHIEYQQRRRRTAQRIEQQLATVKPLHGKTIGLQRINQSFSNGRLILDEPNGVLDIHVFIFSNIVIGLEAAHISNTAQHTHIL
jgi:hypothetical protein